MHPLLHHVLCRVFWWNIKSPRWLCPARAHIWCPVTSGFSLNSNHFWNRRDFRPLMRFRKMWWGSWWRLRELCEAPRCLLWRGRKHHCCMYSVLYLVSSSVNVSIFHITWLDTLKDSSSFKPHKNNKNCKVVILIPYCTGAHRIKVICPVSGRQVEVKLRQELRSHDVKSSALCICVIQEKLRFWKRFIDMFKDTWLLGSRTQTD